MGNNLTKLKITLATILVSQLFSAPAFASNWLMLQGTEPAGAAERARLWGFVQAQYQKDFSDANPGPAGCAPGGTNCYIPPKLIGPNLESQSAFNVNRARIGVRGSNFPLDSKTNYFLLVELGNNGITAPGNSFAKATDASVTFSHIPGARIRAGLFKYPGAEEGLQAIHVFDYINFTKVTNEMLLERFPNKQYTPDIPAQPQPTTTSLNGFEEGVGAFRDVGIQIFDSFMVGPNKDWDLSYALMVGNGNGLNFSDNNGKKDVYMYVSAEKVFGGKGPRREGMKFWAWRQDGKRTADLTDDSTANPAEYDRERSGIGFKYLKKPYRFTAEYMKGEGMIFVGPNNPDFDFGNPGHGDPTAPNSGAYAKSDGWYVEGGWYIPGTKWEIDARYDFYNRLKNSSKFEFERTRWTLGTQYHINKKTRVAINYEMNDDEAPGFASGTCGAPCGPNNNLDGLDDRISVQVTAIY